MFLFQLEQRIEKIADRRRRLLGLRVVVVSVTMGAGFGIDDAAVLPDAFASSCSCFGCNNPRNMPSTACSTTFVAAGFGVGGAGFLPCALARALGWCAC